jgi:electron transfer flavoprotein beta subunit
MNVAVLLAGVADPKRLLKPLSSDPLRNRSDNPVIFSPFDEAALEIALKIRDGRPETAIAAIMTGGPESDALLRNAAAHKLDSVTRVDIGSLALWDPVATAQRLAGALDGLGRQPDLVLIGREFGDYDDGAVAPCLASVLGWPLFDLAQFAQWRDERLVLIRDRLGAEEGLFPASPLVASVTNDRRNRLRHPLMKNVMEARRRTVEVVPSLDAGTALRLQAITTASKKTCEVPCRILGGSLEAQAVELASLLHPWRAAP